MNLFAYDFSHICVLGIFSPLWRVWLQLKRQWCETRQWSLCVRSPMSTLQWTWKCTLSLWWSVWPAVTGLRHVLLPVVSSVSATHEFPVQSKLRFASKFSIIVRSVLLFLVLLQILMYLIQDCLYQEHTERKKNTNNPFDYIYIILHDFRQDFRMPTVLWKLLTNAWNQRQFSVRSCDQRRNLRKALIHRWCPCDIYHAKYLDLSASVRCVLTGNDTVNDFQPIREQDTGWGKVQGEES